MKIRFFQFGLILILFFNLGLTGEGVIPAATGSGRYQAQEIIVSLKPEIAAQAGIRELSPQYLGTPALDLMARQFDVQSVRRVFSADLADPLALKYNLAGTLVLTLGPGIDLLAARNAFRSNPAVDFSELNLRVYASDIPNDPMFGAQWSLHNSNDHDIDAPQAWNITRGRAAVMIAVIDTGVLYTHPDLRRRVRTDIDKDFANNDDDALDDHGHGTHVAGIIGAATNNAKGIAGICWNCSILPIKVLTASGSGSADGVAAGIKYAADKHARIISMSLGIHPDCGCSKTIAQAINYAYEKGSLLIAASGNDGVNGISYPAASSRVVAVGATDKRDQRTSWSNYGKKLDVVAPGDSIRSTWIGNTYDTLSGTSMATPHVSGVAGLIWSRNLNLDNSQVWWALRRSVDDLRASGRDIYTGFGRINANKGVRVPVTSSVGAPVDTCNLEPESGCGGCSTQVALGHDPDAQQSLSTLYAFRDSVLSQSDRGRKWTELFYRHTFEVSELLASDADLRFQAAGVLADSMPAIRLLVAGGTGEPVIVTESQLSALARFKDALVQRASPQLAADLAREWALVSPEQYAGQDILAVWESVMR